MRVLPFLTLAAPLACLVMAQPALAQTNLGFDQGDISGWTQNGGSAGAYGDSWSPEAGSSPTFHPHGGFFGYITAGDNTELATLSQTFALSAGGTISGLAGFANLDGFYADPGAFFNDTGFVAINGVHILDWDGLTVGGFANSGWESFLFTADADGLYTLEIGVQNGGDGNVSSSTLLDSVRVRATPPIPEPASWAMMVLGFGAAGTALRTRRRTVSFG